MQSNMKSYINIQGPQSPAYSGPERKNKFGIFLEKIFCPKQKTLQILPATMEKIKICLFKKPASCSSGYNFSLCVNTEIINHTFK